MADHVRRACEGAGRLRKTTRRPPAGLFGPETWWTGGRGHGGHLLMGSLLLLFLYFSSLAGAVGDVGNAKRFPSPVGRCEAAFHRTSASIARCSVDRLHYVGPEAHSRRSIVATRSWEKKTSQTPSSAAGRRATCSPMKALLM